MLKVFIHFQVTILTPTFAIVNDSPNFLFFLLQFILDFGNLTWIPNDEVTYLGDGWAGANWQHTFVCWWQLAFVGYLAFLYRWKIYFFNCGALYLQAHTKAICLKFPRVWLISINIFHTYSTTKLDRYFDHNIGGTVAL